MPYDSKRELPDAVKRLPEHAQDIYRKAFNSAYEQYNDESKAHATAWSAVKKKYKKEDGQWKRKEGELHDVRLGDLVVQRVGDTYGTFGVVEDIDYSRGVATVGPSESRYPTGATDPSHLGGREIPLEQLQVIKRSPDVEEHERSFEDLRRRLEEVSPEVRASLLKRAEGSSLEVCPQCGGEGVLKVGHDRVRCYFCDGEGIVPADEAEGFAHHTLPEGGRHTDRVFSKRATSEEFSELLRGSERPSSEEPPLSRDTHENPFAAPANRRNPPTRDVIVEVGERGNPRALAYALQIYTTLDAEVEGGRVRVSGVVNPIPLITELKGQGFEAYIDGDRQGSKLVEDSGIRLGEKVAMVGDFPEMNYFPGPHDRLVEATVLERKEDGHYLLENEIWGRFLAEEHEMMPLEEAYRYE